MQEASATLPGVTVYGKQGFCGYFRAGTSHMCGTFTVALATTACAGEHLEQTWICQAHLEHCRAGIALCTACARKGIASYIAVVREEGPH